MSKVRIAFFIVVCQLLVWFPASAQQRVQVQWAGLSLAGQFDQLPRILPIVSPLILTDKAFERRLEDRISDAVRAAAQSNPTVDFVIDRSLVQGDDAYALTLAIAGESVSYLKVENLIEASFELQVLVLVGNVSKDPMRQRVVNSYPLRMRHRMVLSDGLQPTQEDARRIFASMLMGDHVAGVGDLVSEWQTRLSKIKFRERQFWISVSPLRFSPESLQQAGMTVDQAASLSFRATSLVEANLSRAADIPLVPSTYDGALEQITLNFANRGIIAFRKADPSYIFDVSIFALRSVSGEQSMSREKKFLVSYGGGFQLEYLKNDANQQKSSEFSFRMKSVQNVSFIGASIESRRFDNAAMYASLVMNFAEQLSTNVIPANTKWLEIAKAESEPKSVQEIVQLLKKLPSASP